MKKMKMRRLAALLLLSVIMLAACGCTGSSGKAGGSGKKTIRVGYDQENKVLFEDLIPKFEKKYPDIKIEPVEFSSANLVGITTELTSLAAAGKLPDVMIGNDNFAYIVQQGWAYPLDNLLEADADKNDVLNMGLDQYTYNGHLYALPWRMQFDAVVVNFDLINELNMDEPEYDWTISTFVDMAKKATTTKYSGINYIYNANQPTWGFDNKLMGAMYPDGYQQYGYRFDTHSVDLTVNNAWVDTVKIIREFQGVPGLISDDLKDYSLRNEGKADDYDKKFGRNSDAFVSGKVLFGNHSTWEISFINTLEYKWDFYPIPTKDGLEQRIHTHVDYAYMSSALTEDTYEDAYKFLKFLTYDKDGCQVQMDYSINKSTDTSTGFKLYIPATENADIVTAFDNLKQVPDGIKYMYKTVVEDSTKAIISDCDKVVPDFWLNVTTFRDEADKQVEKGADPASLVNDLQTKINSAMNASWSFFSKTVDNNLEEFYKTHPWEKK